jgi:DNA-binding beta-propeller fold protein YncE
VAINTTNFFQLSIPISGNARSLVSHPFLDLIYITSTSGEILILDANAFTIVTSIPVGAQPRDMAISPDGQKLYVSDEWDYGLSVVDLNTHTVTAVVPHLNQLQGLAVAPDGATVYAAAPYSGSVYFIDTASWATTPIAVAAQPSKIALTCDGHKLYVGSGANDMPIIDTAAQTVFNLPMPGYMVQGIAVCPQTSRTGAILFPSVQYKQGALGTAVTYTTTLRNETGQTDSFNLALDGTAWPAELSTSLLGPIPTGSMDSFVVTVTIPAGAAWYDTSDLTVTATSVTSSTVYSDTAVLHTEAYAPPQPLITPDSLSSTQFINSQTMQTLTISNGNGITLTYDLGVFYSSSPPARQLSPSASRPSEWPATDPALEHVADPLTELETAVAPETFTLILTDPPGDGGPADVLEVTAENTGLQVSMQLLFNNGVIPQNVTGYIFLDTDQDSTTGASPVGYSGLSTQDVGFEYYVSLFNSPNSLIVYSSSGAYMGSVTPQYSANSLLFTIPLSLLNNDDGNMNIAMVLGDFAGPTEWVPEIGHGVIGVSSQYSWLTVAPDSGELTNNSGDAITATYDSSALQPGPYQATIRVDNNSPNNPTMSIPVLLTVEPTASMGWVEGYVTDHRFGTPVQATIVAQGQPYTITSQSDGYYKLWLEAGSYDLHVSAEGYVTQQQPITIIAQQSAVLDVVLVEDTPVFGLSPDTIGLTQFVGDVTTATMTLSNDGPAVMTFSVSERDTTSGLALLAPFARSEAEIAALSNEIEAGDQQNEGAPQVAAIPPEAFTALQGTTRLLTWPLYADYYHEYTNSLNAIAQFTTFNLTETYTEDSAVLASLLAMADVFLIPEQENISGSYLYTLGQLWADTLQTFVNAGGTIVILDHCTGGFQLLEGAGLIDMQFANCTYYGALQVVNSAHPLAADVPSIFQGMDGLALFAGHDGESVIQTVSPEYTVVMGKDMGRGHIAVIGFDFYSYNDDMARVLANAVQWYKTDVPWLSVTPMTGSVPGYATLDTAVTLDAAGLQPGLYTADLIVNSNDPYLPAQQLPVSMEVLPTAVMGHVAGAISDAWTNVPLTATVQLQGVYTTTARPNFDIWAEAGVYTLAAFAPGYMTETMTVTISAGGLITQDMALIPAQPRLEGLPQSMTLTAVAGHAITHSFTLSNTGPMPLNFTWHEIESGLRQPAAPLGLNGKSILYDFAHGSYDFYDFDLLVGDITAAGGIVNQNYDPITAVALAPHDVLWVGCCGYTHWTADELTAVSAWLQSGGALFLYGYNTPAVADLAALFDIGYLNGSYSSGLTTNILPHPTSTGISSLYFSYTPASLTFSGTAVPLVYDVQDYLVGAAQEENGGRIVVLTGNAFASWDINSADNRAWAFNIFSWLADPVYTNVPWINMEPVTGTVAAYDHQPFTMTLDAADLLPGTHHMMLALAHDDPAHNPVLPVPVTLEVIDQTAAVAVVADTLSQTAVPGQSASYQISITNLGNAPDSFAIAATGVWPINVSATNTGLLAVGETFTATVTVTVPDTATHNSRDVTAVTITSNFAPTVNHSLALTTTAEVSVYKLYLPIVTRTQTLRMWTPDR